jgi:hypothetical protein
MLRPRDATRAGWEALRRAAVIEETARVEMEREKRRLGALAEERDHRKPNKRRALRKWFGRHFQH